MENRIKKVLLTIAALFFVFAVLLPIVITSFNPNKFGNIALIPIEGPITTTGGSYMGERTVSSEDIVNFIKEAEESSQIEVIMFEINSPGGSAVASDEISSAIKKTTKPTLSVIREVGASGGYWVASSTNHIIANRMSITGSIGVISSYLEFSGLMEKYGVGYEQLIAGKYKDMGTPLRKLSGEEKKIMQGKLDKIHYYFIQEIAENRKMDIKDVTKLATGEFYLGVEALDNGLIDQLGDKDTAQEYIKETYGIEEVDFVIYERELSFFEAFGVAMEEFSFKMGEGMGKIFTESDNSIMLK
jgi:protease IV